MEVCYKHDLNVNCLSTTAICLLWQTLSPNVADDCGLSSCSRFSCTWLALLTSAFLFTLYWYKVLNCLANLDQSILVICNSLHNCSTCLAVPPFHQFLYTTQFPHISGVFFVFHDKNVAFLDRRFFLQRRSPVVYSILVQLTELSEVFLPPSIPKMVQKRLEVLCSPCNFGNTA